MAQNYIYRGFNGDFNQDETGIPAVKEDAGLIEESIRQILLTTRGERVMNPDFGTNIMALVFEHDRQFIESELRDEVTRAIKRWEPRAVLNPSSVAVEFGTDDVILTVTFDTLQDEGQVSLKVPTHTGV
jgi:phage baseplate assembly protein W